MYLCVLSFFLFLFLYLLSYSVIFAFFFSFFSRASVSRPWPLRCGPDDCSSPRPRALRTNESLCHRHQESYRTGAKPRPNGHHFSVLCLLPLIISHISIIIISNSFWGERVGCFLLKFFSKRCDRQFSVTRS